MINTELFTPAQVEQYKKDLLLAQVIRTLGLSESVALKLENLVPTNAVETQFSFPIIAVGDDAILRGYALTMIKTYSDKAKSDFVAENSPPPIIDSLVDLPRAELAGWTYTDGGAFWEFTKGALVVQIQKTDTVVLFNNLLALI